MKKPESTTPKHLRAATAAWFAEVMSEYELSEHHVRLLTLAAESFDRCVEAREALKANGLTYINSRGEPHARPEVQIEKDSRIAFARLLRELALDVSEPADNRPPPISGKAHLQKGNGR